MPAFLSVPRIVTGCGSAKGAGSEAARLGRKALLVTGRAAMRKAGLTQLVLESLRAAGVEAVAFEQVEAEPAPDTIDRGREMARAHGCEVIVSLGGGSAIDAGKAIAALFNEAEPTEQFVRGKAITTRGLPSIAMPTTSGTGSEVTMNSVITLPGDLTKNSIRSDTMLPAVAIVDPELTVSLPPELTAASGLDALTQAIESYVSVHATPLTDGLALYAVRLLAANLETAWRCGTDLAAREACSYGSLMAGIALANARLGVIHGIAHPVGARYRIPHGLVCAVMLPHAMRLNQPGAPEKFRVLSQVIGADAIEFVDGLLERLRVPRTLKPFGLREDDFDAIIQQSLPSGSLKANPKKIDAADVRRILEAVSG